MTTANLLTTTIPVEVGRRPRDDELDLFGVTHPGKVRRQNQDHFLVCTIHQQAVIHGTSLPGPERLPLRGERLATILLVADGVGSGGAGGEASQLATETITRYVSSTLDTYHAAGSTDEAQLLEALRAAALEAHQAVRTEAVAQAVSKGLDEVRGMATTLTLAIAVWPWMYIVQVGDSRCYFYGDGALRQVTRDQTLAQALVEQGVLPAERAGASPFSHVLSSAIGSEQATPEVTRLNVAQRGCVILLCSDGLTKHVSDPEIADRLRTLESSEQAARGLLDLALERGGSDNITVLVARARPRPETEPVAQLPGD